MGCPKGHYSDPVELSPRNAQALDHYQRCKAVGRFPHDAIVERNAGIIRCLEDAYAKTKQDQILEMLGVLLSAKHA